MAHKFYDEVEFYHEISSGKIELCQEVLNKNPSESNSWPYIDFKKNKGDDKLIRLGSNFGMRRLEIDGGLFINNNLSVQGKIETESIQTKSIQTENFQLIGTSNIYNGYTVCGIRKIRPNADYKTFSNYKEYNGWSDHITFGLDSVEYKICRLQFTLDAGSAENIQTYEASISNHLVTTIYNCYDTNNFYYYFLEIHPYQDEYGDYNFKVAIKWIDEKPDVCRIKIIDITLFY